MFAKFFIAFVPKGVVEHNKFFEVKNVDLLHFKLVSTFIIYSRSFRLNYTVFPEDTGEMCFVQWS